mgnify:CR=1 FL=1
MVLSFLVGICRICGCTFQKIKALMTLEMKRLWCGMKQTYHMPSGVLRVVADIVFSMILRRYLSYLHFVCIYSTTVVALCMIV